MAEVTPSMLCASVKCGEVNYILALVALFDSDEGSCVLESTAGDVHNGAWSISRTRDVDGEATPTTLRVEFPDTCEIDAVLLDDLMDQLVKAGGNWGLDGYSPQNGWN